MNIDWDEELREVFCSKYSQSWKKLKKGHYSITFLEGNVSEIECSINGYICNCHEEYF
jgi:hypothetical protein